MPSVSFSSVQCFGNKIYQIHVQMVYMVSDLLGTLDVGACTKKRQCS
jgi:hypothetical protein